MVEVRHRIFPDTKYERTLSVSIDDVVFGILSEHFDRKETIIGQGDPPYSEETIPKNGVFLYDSKKLDTLSREELITVSPYIIAYSTILFATSLPSDEMIKYINVKEIVEKLNSHKVTHEEYLDRFSDFEFPGLGEHSADIISFISSDLLQIRLGHYNSDSAAGHLLYLLKDVLPEERRQFEEISIHTERNFDIEYTLKFDSPPLAARIADNGLLYVLTKSGKLYEYKNDNLLRTFNVPREAISANYLDDNDRVHNNVRMNIAINGDNLLVINRTRISKFSLTDIVEQECEENYLPRLGDYDEDENIISSNELMERFALSRPANDGMNLRRVIEVHDAGWLGDTLLISATDGIQHYIFYQRSEETGCLYQGMTLRDCSGSTFENDDTLTLRAFQGSIFFPRGKGLATIALDGKVIETIPEYKKIPDGDYDSTLIAKFAFGSNFLISIGPVQGFGHPMLQIFRPTYKLDTDLPIPDGETIPPTGFDRLYIGNVPKTTQNTLSLGDLDAQGNKFVMTHPDFNRVYVYKMKD